jgi:Flp pilus assembly protein TadG
MLIRTRLRRSAARRGVAAVELAICLPFLFLLLLGVWEVGRITEVQQVMWNSAREAARDGSLSQDNLTAVANNLAVYLQSAEPNAFAAGHATSLIPPVVSLPANTTGFTCWDTTANRELFTITFSDLTQPTVTDPTGMSQLDRFKIGINTPYTSIRWSPIARFTGVSRLFVEVTWVCMRDAPFDLPVSLPAQ